MINATDDVKVASELWGDAKFWDDDLGQWVPDGGKYDRRAPADNDSGTPAVGAPAEAVGDDGLTDSERAAQAPAE
jgi:hypothetical protein